MKTQWVLGLLLTSVWIQSGPALAENTFTEALKARIRDGVLDKSELAYLRSRKQTLSQNAFERHFSNQFISYLKTHKSLTRIKYSYRRKGRKHHLKFVFSPTYSENQSIHGNQSRTILSHISQHDNLPETTEDGNRCGAAALLNAYYYLHYDFQGAFNKLGINKREDSINYKHIHLAQEALYKFANTDNQPGLVAGSKYSYYSSGKIFNLRPQGEVLRGARLLNLKLHPLMGNTQKTAHKRKWAVQNFWKKNKRGVLMVGIHLNPKTGTIQAPRKFNAQNHFCIGFKRQRRFLPSQYRRC